jgi:hypothetical protein
VWDEDEFEEEEEEAEEEEDFDGHEAVFFSVNIAKGTTTDTLTCAPTTSSSALHTRPHLFRTNGVPTAEITEAGLSSYGCTDLACACLAASIASPTAARSRLSGWS